MILNSGSNKETSMLGNYHFSNLRNNLFESNENPVKPKINHSKNFDSGVSKPPGLEKPFGKRKTTRMSKSRKSKRTRTNRGTDFTKDPRGYEDRRDKSQPSHQNDLGRQKTFDSKQTSKGKVGLFSFLLI